MVHRKIAVFAVDDDPADLKILRKLIEAVPDFDVTFYGCTDADSALRQLENHEVDLIFLDYQLGAQTGLSLLRRLRDCNDDRPVIAMTGQGSERIATQIMLSGADDYLVKGETTPELLAEAIKTAILRGEERREKTRVFATLKQKASRDGLTGIPNRGHFDDRLKKEWDHARMRKSSLGLIMVDIDYFKLYNDRFGHLAGDRCLQNVAQALESCLCRCGDLLARYGGEEFVALLSNTDLPGAVHVASSMLDSVSGMKILHPDSHVEDFVTVSCGCAAIQPAPEDREGYITLLQDADLALYDAKRNGRNRVRAFSSHLQGVCSLEDHRSPKFR